MNFVVRILVLFLLFPLISCGREEAWAEIFGKTEVPFHAWSPDGIKAGASVLVLVPGYNGDGVRMLDGRWKAFAEKNALVLLAPTFHAEGNENNQGKGYYYPEQGSGKVMEKALRDLKQRTGVNTDKVLFFGFSAGAHYVHRFALWRPKRVKAFVAYSAGWWSDPSGKLKSVPALIMCGDSDERYTPTFEFFKKGQKLGCPWIWRSYANTDHVLTPAVRDMAEVFLAYYAKGRPVMPPRTQIDAERWYGDIQTFKVVGEAEKTSIPEDQRIELPSKKVADVWEKEIE
jgi:pimeloyl-ACP methyl ester carboxylesterase